MVKHFSQYTKTVRLLMGNQHSQILQYFCDNNLEEVWTSHDKLEWWHRLL